MSRRGAAPFIETFSGLKRRLSSVVEEGYAPLGISATQAKLLRVIGQSQPMSQADLARGTSTDPALTGRILRTLLDRGWVRRRRSKDDRRAFSLELTSEGEDLYRDVKARRAALHARVERCLDADDRAAFERIAEKLVEAFPEGRKG
jgi:DNA-binding MarR family transcriptional regulator